MLSLSFCTVDGQIFEIGNKDVKFSVQSCSKPVTYAIAVEVNGIDVVNDFIAHEPSGHNFNELCLNKFIFCVRKLIAVSLYVYTTW